MELVVSINNFDRFFKLLQTVYSSDLRILRLEF